MAGGTSNGNSRESDQTPILVVAPVVNAVIIIMSAALSLLKAFHNFREWYTKGKEKALFEALENVKAGEGLLLKHFPLAKKTSQKHKMTTIDEKGKSVVVRAKWGDTNVKILVGLMVDQVKKGNRLTTTFSTKAWHQIMSKFNKKTGNKYEWEQFKNKFNKMKRVYRDYKKLRDIPTGFSWDPNTKTVTAPDPVWDDYLKVNKKAKQFRTKGCPLFDELEIIYGDTTVTSENVGAST